MHALNEIQAHLEADAAQKTTRGLIGGPDFLRYVEEVRAGLDLLDQLLAVVGQSRPRKMTPAQPPSGGGSAGGIRPLA